MCRIMHSFLATELSGGLPIIQYSSTVYRGYEGLPKIIPQSKLTIYIVKSS